MKKIWVAIPTAASCVSPRKPTIIVSINPRVPETTPWIAIGKAIFASLPNSILFSIVIGSFLVINAFFLFFLLLFFFNIDRLDMRHLLVRICQEYVNIYAGNGNQYYRIFVQLAADQNCCHSHDAADIFTTGGYAGRKNEI